MSRAVPLSVICALAFLPLAAVQASTFKNPQLIPTTYDPIGIAAVDLNHDGNLDIVYVDGVGNHALHVLLGKGDGTFSHGQDLSLPSGICGSLSCTVNVADVTHDGNPDVILAGNNQGTARIVTLPGNGDGTFQQPVLSTFQPNGVGNFPYLTGLMAIGDVNGDGAADIAVTDAMNFEIDVLFGDNTGKFTLANTLPTYTRNATYLVDLNGDGHLDIVSMDLIGARFVVLLGNGNGTFQAGVDYNTGAPTGSLILTDLDGDGHPDVVGTIYPGEIVFLKGNSDGTFAGPLSIGNVPSSYGLVAIGDYNSDGIRDLSFLTSAGIGISLGAGDLTYVPIVQSVSGNSTDATMAQGDFNSDGYVDIAMGVEGGIAVLIGNGDGSFKSADVYDLGQQVGAVAVADFNNDKIPDIAVSLSALFPRLLVGTGSGTFNLGPDPNTNYGSLTPSKSMAVGDFEGSGNEDIVDVQATSSNSFGSLQIFWGAGNGAFSSPVIVPYGSTSITDLNNDNRSDMVTVGDSIIGLLGQANGSFTQVTTQLRNPTFAALLGIGDVNNDGKPDLIISAYTDMQVWLGNGDGSFTYANSFGVSGQQFGLPGQIVAIADLDGDGNADVVLGPSSETETPSQSQPLVIFYGNGDGTFQAPVMLPISHQYWGITIADVNGDNRPDLVLSDGVGIAVIINLGARNFDSEEHFVAGQAISVLSVADVNGDGYPDIVAADPGGTTVAVLLNEPNGTPPGGSASIGVFAVAPEPSNYGQPIVFTMSLSASNAGSPLPTGSISFSIDGTFLATVPLVGGTASYNLSSLLAVGNHTLVATYNGDGLYHPESFSKVHVVLPPVYPTQTSLVAAPASVLLSQTVRLTATVTCAQPLPPSSVTFLDGTQSLGAAIVDTKGIALLDTAKLTAGTHTISASYQGYTSQSEVLSPSISGMVNVIVNSTSTTTVLSASTISPTAGAIVTFTANVSAGSSVPFGGVTFYDGNMALGTASLKADGSASYSVASLTAGSHSITAAYNVNATFAGSTSSATVVSVGAPSANSILTFVSLVDIRETGIGEDVAVTAHVNAIGTLPAGKVTILDGGNILGTADSDEAGTATFAIAAFVSGIHILRASFAGTQQLAPSVSPELLEEWPSTGPGFSIRVSPSSMSLTGASSEATSVTVVSASGFRQQVQLSCGSGLPTNYSCVFSPQVLGGTGTSYLRIRPNSTSASRIIHSEWLWPSTTCAIAFLLLLGSCNYRRVPCLMALAAGLGMSGLSGCGQQGLQSNTNPPQAFVVTIQATSGSGATSIIHSVQFPVTTDTEE